MRQFGDPAVHAGVSLMIGDKTALEDNSERSSPQPVEHRGHLDKPPMTLNEISRSDSGARQPPNVHRADYCEWDD